MTAEQLDFRRDLIEGCKRGERQAQRQLYEDYCDAMYNVALRIVGDTHKAEDILQTSFLDVFRAIDSYNYSATPGAWIKRIVINNSISTVRRKGVAMVYLDETPDRAEELPMNEEGLSMTSIKSAIAKLPDGYRTILTLYLIDGYDHGEISDILDISVATSKSQYSRAKKKLRSMISRR